MSYTQPQPTLPMLVEGGRLGAPPGVFQGSFGKSPRGNTLLGDESLPATRVDCLTREASSVGKRPPVGRHVPLEPRGDGRDARRGRGGADRDRGGDNRAGGRGGDRARQEGHGGGG